MNTKPDRRFKRALAVVSGVIALLLCSFSISCAQEQVRQYVKKARSAYAAKDYAAAVENFKAALELRPTYGPFIYNLAAGYALMGDKVAAFEWLNRLADMGLVYPVARNDDFSSIKDSPEFRSILTKLENNAKPVGRSSIAFTLHEKGLVPESIAYDPISKTFYIGSVYKRKIVSINSAGEAQDFSTESDGLWSVMGMRVDAARRILWVCTASHQQMMNFRESENGLSGIFKYDLKTNKLIKKYLLPAGTNHWLGDLVLNSAGDVFTSDSITPAIYVLRTGKEELELFLKSDAFINPQGLAFSSDEKLIFMADYLKGLFVIDARTKAIRLATPPPRATILGIDGLYYYKNSLIGIQNGVQPQRLVRIILDQNSTQVRQLEVLEANNSMFDEPTLAVLSGSTLFYIANSQWGTIDDKGKLAPEEKLREPVVLKMKL
jgi:sugar lactone lactonase YvrE